MSESGDPQPTADRQPHRTRTRQRPWVAIAIFVIGTAVLARAQQYYGALLRGWDAQFYYAAAHSLVFDRDIDISNNLAATPFAAPFDRDEDGYFEAVVRNANGRIISRYPIGLSLIEVPPLALGRAVRSGLAAIGVVSARPPGYSDVEIWAVALGLLFVFAIGGQLLHDVMRPYVPAPWREVALLAAWWGTSLLYYSSVFPFTPHAVGFALLVWAVWIAAAIGAGSSSARRLWLLGFALGALYLVRQQQVLVILPLLLVLAPLRSRPARLWVGWALAGIGTLLAVIAFQTWIHAHLAEGWSADLTRAAKFHWSDPDFWTVLLSPSRGLFWVCPVVALAAVGFVTTPARAVPRPFAVFALHGLLQIFVIASWAMPDQADSFGIRMWSECSAAAACGLGLLYLRRSASAKLLITAAVAACVAWTNRLLMLYVSGALPLGISYAECLRLVFRR